MRKIVSLCLSIIFIVSTSSYSFADTNLDNPPIEPTKPKVENYQDNDKIKEYNKEAEEYNKKVDEYNAAESSRVENSNKEKTEQYNKDKAKYDEDKAKYDEDYECYNSKENQTDIKNEQLILNQMTYQDDDGNPTHFNSVGEYNMLPLKSGKTWDEETQSYLPPTKTLADLAEKAVYRKGVRQENNDLRDKEYTSTVHIQPAEEKSGETFTLYLTHYLLSNGKIYTEKVTFDANDIVTVQSLAYATNAKPLYEDENYGAFYTYQGDKYLSYYWYESPLGSMSNPPVKDEFKDTDIQCSWNKGNQYIFTYKNGKKYYSDSNEIFITYYYVAQMTANTPLSEPIAPTEPTLELETFNPLSHISLLSLFAVPKPIPSKPTKQNTTSFVPFGLGDGPESIESVEPIKKTTIANNNAPLATTEGSWALINLIATLLVFLIAIILLVMAFVNKRKEDEELQIKNKMIGRIISIIVAIITGFIFLITEDMSLPMVLVDKWTLLMIILLIVQLIIMILCKHKEIEKAS